METPGKAYGYGLGYAENSADRGRGGHHHNVTVTSDASLPSWDTVRGGSHGGGSGGGSYFISPSRPYRTRPSLSAELAGPKPLTLPCRLPVQAADPHLTCLKLGKRRCPGDGEGGKRGRRAYCNGRTTEAAARCQVEGCEASFGQAKEYHRRHRVCEEHAKAPAVVVLGLHQRFCQQCSRFHLVSEFDDSKRSCRRRLAGHNERRRKSSRDSVPRNRTSCQGGVLSLLSSRTETRGISPPDFSLQCSAALHELIAEHRATILAHQLVLDRAGSELGPGSSSITLMHPHQAMLPVLPTLGIADETGAQVTLDLMQKPSSASEFLLMRTKQQQQQYCCEPWNQI